MSIITNTTKIAINEDRLEVMKVRILELEKQNLKTKEKSDAQIIGEIRTIIVEEVNKNY